MVIPLRVLIVEDSEDDTLLLIRKLKRGGFDPTFERVETPEAMEATLEKKWDIIIADYVMPHFSGLDALKLLKKSGQDIPFIIVSGKIGEDTAVELMKAGANDYLMKSNLKKLIPTVERELKEAELRRERKHVDEQLRYLSLHDPLTKLYNRAYFEEEINRLEKGRFDAVGIIIGDVDGLKLINDTLGHSVGDAMLVTAASIIRECFRASDVVARVGGDEFVILLPNAERKAVESACLRIQNAVSNYNTYDSQIPLSISLGFAVNRGKPVGMKDLYREADNNMYREKLHHSQSARSAIVQTLKKALEARDFMTSGHVNRLQLWIGTFAQTIGIPEQCVNDLLLLAQFHDIGKVGIPDSILFKSNYLTPGEYAEIQRHCEIGYRIAQSSPDLVPIADLILKHHEWWNGKGYPLGIKGEEIPLECRILAITDAYESMTGERPYRKPMSCEEAIAELKNCAGSQFNPELVDKFVQLLANQNVER